jgi:hypothetical protein
MITPASARYGTARSIFLLVRHPHAGTRYIFADSHSLTRAANGGMHFTAVRRAQRRRRHQCAAGVPVRPLDHALKRPV